MKLFYFHTLLLALLLLGACRPSAPLPSWLAGYKPSEAKKLQRILAVQPGWAVAWEQGQARKGAVACWLGALAELCYYEDSGSWALITGSWLSEVEAAEALLGPGPVAFEKVAGRLAVLVVREDDPRLAGGALAREDLPGTRSLLVLESGAYLRPLVTRDCAGWGQTEAALYARALTRTATRLRKELRFEKENFIPAMQDASLTRAVGSSPLTASLPLIPEALPDWQAGKHWIWAAPNSRTALVTPLENVGGFLAGSFLVDLALRSSSPRPGLVSTKVYLDGPAPSRKLVVLSYQTNVDRLPEISYPEAIQAHMKERLR